MDSAVEMVVRERVDTRTARLTTPTATAEECSEAQRGLVRRILYQLALWNGRKVQSVPPGFSSWPELRHQVYPAAGLVPLAQAVIEINPGDTRSPHR